MSHDVTKKVKEVERKEKIILEKNEKIRKVSQEVESTRLEIKRVKSNTQKGKLRIGKRISIKTQVYVSKMVLHLKKEQENAEWLKRANVNMMVDNKKFVAYKEVKEELKNSADKDIMEFYGELVFRKVDPAARPLMKDVGTTMGVRLEERDTNRRGSEYVYTEKDVEEMIARMKEEH
ncbi:unnamed protein product [Rhizophagus irregularis]|nr:unnamed protein product [Rhizophagus irregularis]